MRHQREVASMQQHMFSTGTNDSAMWHHGEAQMYHKEEASTLSLSRRMNRWPHAAGTNGRHPCNITDTTTEQINPR